MKYICLVLIGFTAVIALMATLSTVSADHRMETVGEFCHIPVDAVDTNNEKFIGGCENHITPVNGVATGYASGVMEHVYWQAAIATLDIAAVSNAWNAQKDYVLRVPCEQGNVCNMVDSNGTTYRTSECWSQLTLPPMRAWYTDVRYELYCFGGAAQ